MKVSQGAGSMIAAEILAQPLQLRRSGIAPFHVFASLFKAIICHAPRL